MVEPITIALSKGRILKDTLPLLAESGITVAEPVDTSRKLIFDTNLPNLKLVEVEQIAEISSRLIVNKASMKLKRSSLQNFIDQMAGAVQRAQK